MAEFDAEIAKVAARVATGAPISFRAIKETVRAQYWHSPAVASELETRWAALNDASQDFAGREGGFPREAQRRCFKGV